MRLSSVSMSETRSRSSVVIMRMFLMIGGVKTVSEIWTLRLEKEAMDLTFLMIEDIVSDVLAWPESQKPGQAKQNRPGQSQAMSLAYLGLWLWLESSQAKRPWLQPTN